MLRLSRLFLISRPLLWPVPVVFLVSGLVLSKAAVDWRIFLLVFAFTFPFGLAGYGLNDLYDRVTDRKNPRKRMRLQRDEMMPLRKAVFIALGIMACIALMTMNSLVILLMACIILMGVGYSLPPLRFKNRPPLDSVVNGVFYGTGPFLMGAAMGSLTWRLVTIGLLVGVGMTAMHMYATLFDITPDRLTKQKTFVIRFGIKKTMLTTFLLVLSILALGQFSHIVNGSLVLCLIVIGVTTLASEDHVERVSLIGSRIMYIGFLTAAILALFVF